MLKLITIINLLASTCSILGFSYLYFSKRRPMFNKVVAISFIITGGFSLYMLIVPGNFFEQNIRNKVDIYNDIDTSESNQGLMIQRGVFSFSGLGPHAIEFSPYYAESPVVEIINIGGYDPKYTPVVQTRTPNQAILIRDKDFFGSMFAEYVWIARGKPINSKVMEAK